MTNTLEELVKGFAGKLNMSQPMEDLAEALGLMQVPGRNPFHTASWEKFAWASQKGLMPWFQDSLRRVEQLVEWSATLELPHSLWIGALFNPTSSLTAIKQVVARSTKSALDQMSRKLTGAPCGRRARRRDTRRTGLTCADCTWKEPGGTRTGAAWRPSAGRKCADLLRAANRRSCTPQCR